jgi:hypothetical protein
VLRLEDSLETLIEQHKVGELDGNEFGGGEAVLYCYGPDADRLFDVIEQELRLFTARPAYVTLRYGEATDTGATERRIDLLADPSARRQLRSSLNAALVPSTGTIRA